MATGLLVLSNDGCKFVNQTYDEYMNQEPVQMTEVKQTSSEPNSKKEVKRALSPEARRREIAKLERLITEKEVELEEMRELRFEPEYYQDYQKMNDLDQDIDDIHTVPAMSCEIDVKKIGYIVETGHEEPSRIDT